MKTVLILQAFGLGDCIWAQGIAHHFLQQGYTVVWPVKDKYFEGLSVAYPKINWVPDSIVKPELFMIKEKKLVDDILISPIRWSDSFMKVPYKDVMRAKYDMYNLDWKSWKEKAKWKPHTEKQLELFTMLGLKNRQKFNLVNTRFGSRGEQQVPIEVSNKNKIIEMREIPGFSLFDWELVIRYATEIHTVSTSILYMLEVMELSQPIHLYVRKPQEQDFSFVEYIFTKPYILHI